jgi:hypothetical protein
MERHLSVGVATIVALMQAHRTGSREDAAHNDDYWANVTFTDHPDPEDEILPVQHTRH